MRPTTNARLLRKNSTDAERVLWEQLRSRSLAGWMFRRQAPIGQYVVDFVCFEQKLVVEVDGGHHQSQVADDKVRTAWLESQDFRVLRFWNNEVLANVDGVIEVVLQALNHPHLSPLPSRERKLAPSPSKGEGWDEGEGTGTEEAFVNDSNSAQDSN